MDAVAVMTDWRVVLPFQCEVIERNENGAVSQIFHLHAEPRHSSYALTDTHSGVAHVYDDATRTLMSAGQAVHRETNSLVMGPVPVRLAFPMDLPIWGRTRDQFRMVGAMRHGDQIEVSIRGKEDRELSGSLRVDLSRRLVTYIDAPTLHLEYRGIEFAPPRWGSFAR